MKSEKEKMVSGEMYNPLDPQLVADRHHARLLFKAFNDTSDDQLTERRWRGECGDKRHSRGGSGRGQPLPGCPHNRVVT